MVEKKKGSMEEHLASFEDAFGDGSETYWQEVEERQKTPKSRARKSKKTLLKRIADGTHLSGKAHSEQRDKVAEEIKAAKTHDEKMAIAKKHHDSVNNPDRYAFPKKWQRDLLKQQNRTALKFKKEKTK